MTKHSFTGAAASLAAQSLLTAEAAILIAVLLGLLLLPLLVLLDAPLPGLLPLQIHSAFLRVRLQAQSLRKLPLLLQALELLSGDLRLLVVLDEVFAVGGRRSVL